MFRIYKSTKGIRSGNVSFDDRAYLHIRIAENLSEDWSEKANSLSGPRANHSGT